MCTELCSHCSKWNQVRHRRHRSGKRKVGGINWDNGDEDKGSWWTGYRLHSETMKSPLLLLLMSVSRVNWSYCANRQYMDLHFQLSSNIGYKEKKSLTLHTHGLLLELAQMAPPPSLYPFPPSPPHFPPSLSHPSPLSSSS